MHHEKKIQKKYYDSIRHRLKMFEIRKNDVSYHEGDTISFKDLDGNSLQGKWMISFVLRYEDFPEGIAPGYAILSLINI